MTKQFSNEIKDGDCSPPGAGRSFTSEAKFTGFARNCSGFYGSAVYAFWQLAPERDANTTHRNGNNLGMAFPVRSDAPERS